jgi:hypothetical protein
MTFATLDRVGRTIVRLFVRVNTNRQPRRPLDDETTMTHWKGLSCKRSLFPIVRPVLLVRR